MTTLGIIGAGNIGSQLARQAVAHGHHVVIANSRGPETLTELVGELGERARAATAQEAAEAADLAVITVPLKALDQMPAEQLANKIVIDTNNYYPQRDGNIAELDEELVTSSELAQRHLAESRVVKAFNHIQARHITEHAAESGAAERRALAVFGDDAEAKTVVSSLIDEFGFDVVDGGTLAESWRIQTNTPGYGPRLDVNGLTNALAQATRPPQ